MVLASVRSKLVLIAVIALTSLWQISDKAVAAGAVAFGQGDDGAWVERTSYNYQSQEEADSAALGGCNRNQSGVECKIIARPSNTCFAIAVMTFGNGYSWRINTDRSTAVNEAMLACSKMGGCTPQDSFCEGTAQNPDDTAKLWSSIIIKSMYRTCARMGQCYQNCQGHPANLGAAIYRACTAVCNANFKECMAFQRRDEQAYRRASNEIDEAQRRYGEALNGDTPPQQADDSPPASIEDLPHINTTPDQRARGYGGFH